MRSECKICKKWKEQMYWSEFQVVQFFQILSGIFDQQLAIPKKFANNLREKLGDSVSLTGPSGATWNVRLTLIGDALFLKNGWKEFVDAHSLEEDDLLIFKYNGSRFDVSVFHRQSLCEKEASCFVKKCEHADVASRSRTKRHTPREYSSRDVYEAPPTKKPNLAATPTSEDTSKSSSHDEYEPPAKKKTLASTSTSADTNASSSHNECEPPTEKKTTLASTSTSRTRSARANAKLRS
ncbi:B3 domain-containing protein REM16-like [Capsicum galapagoense]